MIQLFAFRRSLRFTALALCSASIVVSVTPASARPHHGAGRHARAYHAGHHAKHHYAHRHHRHAKRSARRWERGVRADAGRRLCRHERKLLAKRKRRSECNPDAARRRDGAQRRVSVSSNVVAEARRYLGGNPTGRGSLWCARFTNMVLQHSGYRGTGSDMASSFAKYGQRVSGPQVGAIAVMTRGRRGGHVGIITGIDASGNPIMISGNNGNRVREAPVSRGRIYAYVMPASSSACRLGAIFIDRFGDSRQGMRSPFVEMGRRRAVDGQAEQFRPAVVAARVHQLLAPVDQREIEIGDHLAFAGTYRFADQFTFGRDDRGEAAAGDRPDAASGILHDLGLLFGIQPSGGVDDEAAGLQGRADGY